MILSKKNITIKKMKKFKNLMMKFSKKIIFNKKKLKKNKHLKMCLKINI